MSKLRIFSGLLFLFLAAGVAGMAAKEVRYTVTDLGAKTQASRINAAGDIAGTLYLPNGEYRSFIYVKGERREIGEIGRSFNITTGLSDDGRVVGISGTGKPGPNGRELLRPFVHASGVLSELSVTGLPAGVGLRHIHDMNGSGVMAGLTDERPQRLCIVTQGQAAIVTTPKEFTRAEYVNVMEVNRINSVGQVIGAMSSSQMKPTSYGFGQTNTTRHGFLYSAGQLRDLGEFIPADINQSGQMVGMRPVKDGKGQAVFHDGNQFVDLGVPPGFESGSVTGINATGTITGSGQTVTGGGFLWIGVDGRAFIHEQGRWQDLNELVDLTGTSVTSLFSADAINDRGQILCNAMGAGGHRTVLLTPVESASR